MGKGSDFERRIRERPLTREDVTVRPELRVRQDAPSVEVDDTTPVQSVLDHLDKGQQGVVLRGKDHDAAAVMLTPERYAELAGCEVVSEGRYTAGLDGTIRPSEAVLGELMIEQLDPNARWTASRIWPLKSK